MGSYQEPLGDDDLLRRIQENMAATPKVHDLQLCLVQWLPLGWTLGKSVSQMPTSPTGTRKNNISLMGILMQKYISISASTYYVNKVNVTLNKQT